MKTEIKANVAELKVDDCIKNINDNKRYRVVHINLVYEKVIVVSIDYANTALSLSIDDDNFELI